MLKGSYTESETNYGKLETNQYSFRMDIGIKYELETNTEKFEIQHKCGFFNQEKSRMIIIQENSPLTGNANESYIDIY